MKQNLNRRFRQLVFLSTIVALAGGLGAVLLRPATSSEGATLNFGLERTLGHADKNPAAPFLRIGPDGLLHAVWTEADDRQGAKPQPPHQQDAAHQHAAMTRRNSSPMRITVLSSSADGGKTWSAPRQVNNDVEAVQGDENGPKLAFNRDKKAFVVWSIPGDKGDITRANIRFAMDNGRGGLRHPGL
jgi:hypothetical protein